MNQFDQLATYFRCKIDNELPILYQMKLNLLQDYVDDKTLIFIEFNSLKMIQELYQMKRI